MQNELKKVKKLHGGRFFARKGTFLGHDLSGIYERKKANASYRYQRYCSTTNP